MTHADGRLRIEETDSCTEQKNLAVLKRVQARSYDHHSPAQAVKLMRRGGVPDSWESKAGSAADEEQKVHSEQGQ